MSSSAAVTVITAVPAANIQTSPSLATTATFGSLDEYVSAVEALAPRLNGSSPIVFVILVGKVGLQMELDPDTMVILLSIVTIP